MSFGYDDIVGISGELKAQPVKPIYTLKGNAPDADKLKWLKTQEMCTQPAQLQRFQQNITNLALFKGIHWESQDPFADFRNPNTYTVQDTRKIVVNDPHRTVRQLVGKLTRYRPDVVPIPATNNFEDIQGSRVSKKALETHDQRIHIGSYLRRVCRRAMINGQSIAFILFNEDLGSYSTRWLAAQKKYGDKKMRIGRGDKEWIYNPDIPERVGEIDCPMPLDWEVTLDPQKAPEDVGFVRWDTWEPKEKVMRDHPELRDKIATLKPDTAAAALDTSTLQVETLADHIKVSRLWARSSKYLRSGRYMKAIPGQMIIEDDDNPLCDLEVLQASEWGDLPIERMTDIDIDGQLNGYSSMNLIRNMVHTRNMCLTMWNRNLMLYGHPKFMVHRASKVSFEALGNDTTIVEWSGMQAPKLENFATLPQGLDAFYELLGEEVDKQMRLSPINMGTPPPGVTAGVAIRLLEEVEDLMLDDLIKKQNKFCVDFARKRLAVMGKFYKKDDGRLIRMMGKDGQDIVEDYNPEVLKSPYDLRLERENQLARSPAAKTQQVIDLLGVKPDSMTNDQITAALELTDPDKVTDPALTAVTAAEHICELCSQGKEVPKPRQGENHITAWSVQMAYFQRPGFAKLPEDQQKQFKDHLLCREFLMSEHALQNPSYLMPVLKQLQGWPSFYNLPPEQRQMIAQLSGTLPPPPQGAPKQNPQGVNQPQAESPIGQGQEGLGA